VEGIAVNENSALRNIIIGGLICAIGTIVTIATYTAAREGGTYVVAWGAILFGGIQLLYGIYQMASGHSQGKSPKKDLEKYLRDKRARSSEEYDPKNEYRNPPLDETGQEKEVGFD